MTLKKLMLPIAVALLVFPVISQAKPKRERCVPNGTANEQIGCLQNEYVDLWEKLVAHYGKYLDEVVARCARENTGGGSGGHEDRVTCVLEAYEDEAKRINLRR